MAGSPESPRVTSAPPPKLRIAVLCTSWFENSHAEVLVPRLHAGFTLDGASVESSLTVASVYLEQVGGAETVDRGLDYLREHRIPRALSIGEALASGGTGVNVDGVVIIGEHGDYEVNEFGQQLYPRRRFFDAAVAAMVAAGRTVPVFNDKGISYSTTDAVEMVETSRRLGFAFGAGSTIPLSWRSPQSAALPLSTPLTAAVLVGFGPTERYGFHGLEGLQAHVERREGGETGVSSVEMHDVTGQNLSSLSDRVNVPLLREAVAEFALSPTEHERALASASIVIDVEYRDGLRAQVVLLSDVVRQFAIACEGPTTRFSCQMWLQGAPENGHFSFLAAQIDELMTSGRAPIPIERTLLTTGILDAAMQSITTGVRVPTPLLDIAYPAADRAHGTGVNLPRPAGWTPVG